MARGIAHMAPPSVPPLGVRPRPTHSARRPAGALLSAAARRRHAIDVDDAARSPGAGSTRAHAVISIERCGRSRRRQATQHARRDVSSFTPALDDLFLAAKWRRIAIGDGGNEIAWAACRSS